MPSRKVSITEQYLKDIADALRVKLKTEDPIATTDMASSILSIEVGKGAYKVSSLQEMYEIDDMELTDYCIIIGDSMPYLVYEYTTNGWVERTDDILVPTTTVTPTTSAQTLQIPQGYEGFKEVNIEAVTAAIDSNITPANIKLGATILGVAGNCEPDKPDQTKTVTPTTQEQVITADTGYELGSVVVQGVTSDVDQNITSRNIKRSVQILGVNGAYSTGAYKVSTIEQMNTIDDMVEGDYCIIDSPSEYIIPEVCVFTRYQKGWAEIKNDAKNHLFIFRSGSSTGSCARSTTNSIAALAISNNTYTVDVTIHPEFIWKFTEKDGVWRVGDMSGAHFLKPNGQLTTNESEATTSLSVPYYSNNAPISSHNDRSVFYIASSTLWNSSYGTQSSAAGWNTNTAWMLYACELFPANTKYLVYQYNNGEWVDATTEVIYPLAEAQPSTSTQYINTPSGYLGMQTVKVLPVTSAIDTNIVPNKILQGVNILGVTGNVIKADTYTVNNIPEMYALTGVEEGQYCILKQTDNSKYYFKRFTGNIDDIIAGKYDNDYVFAWSCYIYESSKYSFVTSINAKTDYGWENSYRETVYIDTGTYDAFALSKTDVNTPHRVCTIEHYAGKTQLRWLDNNFMFNGIAKTDIPSTSNVLNYMHIDDYYKYSDNTYSFHCYNIGTNHYYIGSYSYWFAGSHYVRPNSYTNTPPSASDMTAHCRLYYARKDTTQPYVLYQRQGSSWIEVTNEVMTNLNVRSGATPQVINIDSLVDFGYKGYNLINVLPPIMSGINVIPSTNAQSITPSGVDVGFNVINIDPVTYNIDANITAQNIKNGVNILGIVGTLEGDPEELAEAQTIVTNIINGYGGV